MNHSPYDQPKIAHLGAAMLTIERHMTTHVGDDLTITRQNGQWCAELTRGNTRLFRHAQTLREALTVLAHDIAEQGWPV